MRIVHFSDWHWEFVSLPEADLYVCTGDMYDNYPIPDPRSKRDPRRYSYSDWTISHEHEVARQLEAAQAFVAGGGFRDLFTSPDAPVVCVRGNHDYAPLSPLFSGCNLVHEFIDNELVEVGGIKITGHRGIPWIYGTWSDEVERESLMAKVNGMPDADLFLTHYPPHEMLDYDVRRGVKVHYGLSGMLGVIRGKMKSLGLHCFGHIHERGGVVKEIGGGSIIGGDGPRHVFSNAACNVNVIDL